MQPNGVSKNWDLLCRFLISEFRSGLQPNGQLWRDSKISLSNFWNSAIATLRRCEDNSLEGSGVAWVAIRLERWRRRVARTSNRWHDGGRVSALADYRIITAARMPFPQPQLDGHDALGSGDDVRGGHSLPLVVPPWPPRRLSRCSSWSTRATCAFAWAKGHATGLRFFPVQRHRGFEEIVLANGRIQKTAGFSSGILILGDHYGSRISM